MGASEMSGLPIPGRGTTTCMPLVTTLRSIAVCHWPTGRWNGRNVSQPCPLQCLAGRAYFHVDDGSAPNHPSSVRQGGVFDGSAFSSSRVRGTQGPLINPFRCRNRGVGDHPLSRSVARDKAELAQDARPHTNTTSEQCPPSKQQGQGDKLVGSSSPDPRLLHRDGMTTGGYLVAFTAARYSATHGAAGTDASLLFTLCNAVVCGCQGENCWAWLL